MGADLYPVYDTLGRRWFASSYGRCPETHSIISSRIHNFL